MRVVVQKYGGSSVADLDKLRRVARRVADTVADGTRAVVVVSAMGNTTNELIELARSVSPQPDRRELDMLISVGERISMALLAMALRELDVPARSLTGSQSGIITDEAHADANVVEVRPDRLQRVLDSGRVAIVAGFQGVSRAREVTTLGRGGSDTTAVVLAAALGAEHCEICSDVDGVWSADPRVVPDAIKLDAMSLDEALALARGGAKVLFEDAVRYARDNGVTLKATTTFGPGSGTRLSTVATPREGITAVTGDKLVRATVLAPGARVRRRVGAALLLDTKNAHGDVQGEATGVVTIVGSGLCERYAVVEQAESLLEAASIPYTACGASGDEAWWEVGRERLDDAVRALHGLVHTEGD